MPLAQILGLIRRLRTTEPEDDVAFQKRVLQVFSTAFAERRRAAKKAYVKEVVESGKYTQRQLGRLLGYTSSGSIDGAMEGRISDDKFELLRATVGKELEDSAPKFPKTQELICQALIDTVNKLAGHSTRNGDLVFDREAFECVDSVLKGRWKEIFADGHRSLEASSPSLLDEAHAIAGSNRLTKLEHILEHIEAFGELLLRVRHAIPGQEG